MKKIWKVLLFVCLFVSLTTTANAMDIQKDSQAIATSISQALESTTKGEYTISLTGYEKSEMVELLKSTKLYLDAVLSYTPDVTLSVKGGTVFTFKFSNTNKDLGEISEVSTLLANLKTLKPEEAINKVNAFICEKTVYDEEVSDAVLNGKQYNVESLTAYGAIVKGKAVCQGYSNAFSFFMDSLDIQSIKMRGYVGEVYHVWNVVKISDNYFVVDCTFNDSSNSTKYLLIPIDTYLKTLKITSDCDYKQAFDIKY